MGNGGDDKKVSSPESEEKYLDKPTEVFSRDLLQSFLGSTSEHETMREGEQKEEEIELNLGLSLGGAFGLDPKKLVRSSSTASFLPTVINVSDTSPSAVAAKCGLARTSSMPVETLDERRKRKELQSLRRMEAKRRKSDKEMEVDWMGDLEREKKLDISAGRPVFEDSSNLGGGIDVAMAKGKGVSGWGSGGMHVFGQILSQGSSVESTGGGSSGLSELESKALKGSSGEISPASTLSLRERSKLDVGSSSTQVLTENPGIATGSLIQSSPVDASRTGGRDTRMSTAVEDMPSVYTRGDGPNGRRVDGILYRYSRGEEVRIMCICHGTFHSPAEFVLHAGGTNVDNPLRHIVIIPNSSPLL